MATDYSLCLLLALFCGYRLTSDSEVWPTEYISRLGGRSSVWRRRSYCSSSCSSLIVFIHFILLVIIVTLLVPIIISIIIFIVIPPFRLIVREATARPKTAVLSAWECYWRIGGETQPYGGPPDARLFRRGQTGHASSPAVPRLGTNHPSHLTRVSSSGVLVVISIPGD